MDSLHCMRCGHSPQFCPELRFRYFMTSCGHLVCEKCKGCQSSEDMCPVCSGGCKFVEIASQNGSDLKLFFMDPVSIIKEALQKPVQVFQFQHQLQKSYNRFITKLMENQKAMKSEIDTLKTELATIRQLNATLTEVLEKSQKELNDMRFQRKEKNTFELFQVNCPSSDNVDVLNILRDDSSSSARPNAQVQPNIHLYETETPANSVNQISPSPFPTPRTPARSGGIRFTPNIRQPFSLEQQTPRTSQRFYTHRSSVQESPAFYQTPVSTPSAAGLLYRRGGGGDWPGGQAESRSPFNMPTPRPDMNTSMVRNTPEPDFIKRLRNLKCRT